jgi:hypothetical protein
VADDRVAAAVAELYGADPDAFTERRKALAAAAREAGDKQSAAAIGALRKPTRAAWVVNRLARSDPDAAGRMAALAADLRAAERAKDGPRLRELSAARGSLLDGLVAQALAAAGTPDPPPSLRTEVTDTLTAALADPATAAEFAAGTLTKAAQWGGFGFGVFPVADDAPAADSSAAGTGRADSVVPAPVDITVHRSRRARTAAAPGDAGQAAPARPRTTRPQERGQREREQQEREQRRLAEEERRRAQEAAERAARAREKFEDAERTLAQASAVAAEAVAVEDGLEAEVRQLEQRLTKAREELATARMRARRAEGAERRARQALDRLPGSLRRLGLEVAVLQSPLPQRGDTRVVGAEGLGQLREDLPLQRIGLIAAFLRA